MRYLFLAFALLFALFILAINSAFAKDPEFWKQRRLAQSEYGDNEPGWFGRQIQPDTGSSCCGPADAYWADKFEVKNGMFFAIITDTRDDALLNRPHIPVGTRIYIPPFKNNDPHKSKDPNPTEHGIVFTAKNDRGVWWPYCYFNLPGDL